MAYEHELDRSRFELIRKRNMALADVAEREAQKQRDERKGKVLKPLSIGKVTEISFKKPK